MSEYLDLLEKILLDKVYASQTIMPDTMPLRAYTALSEKRLRNVRTCCELAGFENVPGAFVECGVWRGGSTMMMAAANKYMVAQEWDEERNVYMCDSFEGLPRPSHKEDANLNLFLYKELQVSEAEVRANFDRLGLLDSNVYFVKGWFKDTLPKLKEEIGPIAVLRSDGDLYESTRNVLDNLYSLISPGGYYIEDDYYNIHAVHQAVDDFRRENTIHIPIERIDNSGCFWRLPR